MKCKYMNVPYETKVYVKSKENNFLLLYIVLLCNI